MRERFFVRAEVGHSIHSLLRGIGGDSGQGCDRTLISDLAQGNDSGTAYTSIWIRAQGKQGRHGGGGLQCSEPLGGQRAVGGRLIAGTKSSCS